MSRSFRSIAYHLALWIAVVFASLALFAPNAAEAIHFSGPTNFAAHTSPNSVAIGDLNGDGNKDLVVANGVSNDVSILLGNGAGSFSAPTNLAAHGAPTAVAIGDFNGDSKPDLAVANSISNDVSILLANPMVPGAFLPATNFAAGNHPYSIAIGDLNGDGKLDLAVANCGMGGGSGCGGASGVTVLLGNGSGGFSAPTTFAAGTGVRSVAIGDLNGDGKPDLAVANGASNDVSILLGKGSGGFSAPANFAAGSFPESVAIGDLNGDSKPDLVVANCSFVCGSGSDSGNVSILLGNGAGSFSAAVNFTAGTGPESVVIGDLNGDSKPDLAVANGASNDVSILLGTGSGSFSAPIDFTAHASPEDVAIGDLNHDSRPDVVIANQNTNDVSVLLSSGGGFNWGFGGGMPATFAAHTGPISIAIGSLNPASDANPDLAVANQGSGDVSVLTGNGTGGFSGPANFPVHASPCCQPSSVAIGDFGNATSDLAVANKLSGDVASLLGNGTGGFSAATGSPFAAHTAPTSVAVGDFNGDAIQDLAVANSGSNDVSILLGNGAGGFSAPTNFATHTGPSSVAVGDFEGRGVQDLAIANSGSNDVSILLGNGDGTFSAPVSLAVHTNPASVAVGDLNGDGVPDLAVANKGSNDVSALLGDGNGGFHSAVNFAVGTAPVSIAIGDLNGDEKPDLAVANNGSNNVSILLNTTPPSYPRPKGATPLRASLVIAYASCASPNSTHGAPLSYGSCSPPVQASPYLTVGTPDANGAGAKGIGSVLLNAVVNPAPTPSDVLIDVSTTDVRCSPAESACGSANAADGPDYTGQLQASLPLRLTDKFNGATSAGGAESGTVEDATFAVPVSCAATVDNSVGSTCSVSTSANAVLPGSAQTGNRAIWALGQVQVFDGGANGVAGAADARLFEDEGVFVP